MLYDIIVSDPPWRFGDKLKKMKRRVKRSADAHYQTMSTSEIASLDVKQLANPEGCVLALWFPSSMLKDALIVAESWNFVQKQIFTWVKIKKDHFKELDPNLSTRMGMGRLFRGATEHALICTSGKSVYKTLNNKGQRSVAFDLNKNHSSKTELLQDRLELMWPGAQKLEMFSRRDRDGWTCIGNEVCGGEDIRVSLKRLIDER